MNWLSLVLIGIIGLVTWRAYTSGFVRELVSLCVTILAIPVAGIFYGDLFHKLHPIIENENVAYLASFLSILIGVVIAGQVAAHLLKRTVAMLNLGGADRVVGAAFGFLKAVILCQVVLIVLIRFPEPDLQSNIDDSDVATRLLDAAPAVLAFLPSTFETTIHAFLGGVGLASQLQGILGNPTPPK